MEKRLENIEVKLSYLEQALSSLNEIVIEQQKESLLNKKRIEALNRKIETLSESEDIPNRKPPHY